MVFAFSLPTFLNAIIGNIPRLEALEFIYFVNKCSYLKSPFGIVVTKLLI